MSAWTLAWAFLSDHCSESRITLFKSVTVTLQGIQSIAFNLNDATANCPLWARIAAGSGARRAEKLKNKKRQKGLLQHNLAPMFLLLKANLLKKKKSYSGKYLRRNAVKRLFGSIFYNLLWFLFEAIFRTYHRNYLTKIWNLLLRNCTILKIVITNYPICNLIRLIEMVFVHRNNLTLLGNILGIFKIHDISITAAAVWQMSSSLKKCVATSNRQEVVLHF